MKYTEGHIKEILEFHPQAVPMQDWQKTEMDYRINALYELLTPTVNVEEIKKEFDKELTYVDSNVPPVRRVKLYATSEEIFNYFLPYLSRNSQSISEGEALDKTCPKCGEVSKKGRTDNTDNSVWCECWFCGWMWKQSALDSQPTKDSSNKLNESEVK